MSLGSAKNIEAAILLDPGSPLRRYYEELADNLLSLEGVRTAVVTSPEAGAGCTSVCLGLAAAIAGMGRASAVVDLNFQNPRVHKMLGEPNFVGLTSCLVGEKPLESYGHEVVPRMLVIPAGPVPPSSGAVMRSGKFVESVRTLGEGRDLVLLDGPTVEGVIARSSLSYGFDGVLLVVHASRTSKQVAREATDDLLDADVNLLGVVLNGCL
ncbi:MAG: CpsD/CapB family tyrosine-protein kinase [Rubrobacter sp.]|nr:CpsD/CapB family tyrosine-protein kinase [Rubrobacter sp.]